MQTRYVCTTHKVGRSVGGYWTRDEYNLLMEKRDEYILAEGLCDSCEIRECFDLRDSAGVDVGGLLMEDAESRYEAEIYPGNINIYPGVSQKRKD